MASCVEVININPVDYIQTNITFSGISGLKLTAKGLQIPVWHSPPADRFRRQIG